jgi:hypothetical protein
VQRSLSIPKAPQAVPEQKREAAFAGVSIGTAGRGLTGAVEGNAIVAADKTKGTDRIAERLSGAMYRWFSRLRQPKLFPRENGSDRGVSCSATSHPLIRAVLIGNSASQAKTETLTDLFRAHGLWFYF